MRTVHETCFFVSLRRPRPCEHARQVPAVRSDDNGVPRLQFIDGFGHCVMSQRQVSLSCELCRRPLRFLCAVPLARLLSSRCCATTGAGLDCCLVEVPLLQFIDGPSTSLWWWSRQCMGRCRSCSFFDSRRNFSCGAEAVWGCKLRENRRLSTVQFLAVLGVISSHC